MGNIWHELRDFWFTINMWARNVIRILIASPIIVLLTALVTVSGWAIAIATILPVLLFAALVLGYTDPLLFGIGAASREGRKVFAFLAGLVGLELLIGLLFLTLYGWEVPVLPIMLLIMFTAAAFLHIGGLLKGWAKKLIILASITIFLIYWWPGIFRAAKTTSRRTSSAIEQCVNQGGGFGECLNKNLSSVTVSSATKVVSLPPVEFRIPLLGENVKSNEGVDLDGMAKYRPGWRYIFEGPLTAKVYWEDGTEGSISKNFGVKGGRILFSGPVGEMVTVRFVPPS